MMDPSFISQYLRGERHCQSTCLGFCYRMEDSAMKCRNYSSFLYEDRITSSIEDISHILQSVASPPPHKVEP